MTNGYEYVIVGSGIAATLVCDRLLEADPQTSILMLEAGGIIPSRDRRSWWDLVLDRRTPYENTYDDDNDSSPEKESFSTGDTRWAFKESRVRAYGGSTMHWGRLVYPPIEHLDVSLVPADPTRPAGQHLLVITVPPQPRELIPFLVIGTVAGDQVLGNYVGLFQRRGEDTLSSGAASIHAGLSAGLALLRGRSGSADG